MENGLSGVESGGGVEAGSLVDTYPGEQVLPAGKL